MKKNIEILFMIYVDDLENLMHIKVCSGRVQYEFDITEKYTILKGDSGTGKTTLSDLVSR